MKTIFSFTESMDKQKVIIKHDKDVRIYKETRKDHIEWKDSQGNILEYRKYIVIRFPKQRKVDWKKWKWTYDESYSLGFVLNELEDDIELLFYDRITFSWRLYNLEKMGLFKVRQRIIPSWSEYGELFPCYINARGIREWTYNLVCGMIQLPFTSYKDKLNKETIK